MKAVVAAFNQEKALVGSFSVITNLRMDIRFKLYYKVFHEDADKIGHDAAEYQCACRGGYSLAKIETAEENEFVKSLLLGDDAWIGLNDKASQTNYVWADGSSLGSYTNWDTSE